eukprot:11478800-Heterocapsa_arctica.AAC.1
MKCRSWRGTVTCVRREKVGKLQMDEKERYRGELPVQCEAAVRSISVACMPVRQTTYSSRLGKVHQYNATRESQTEKPRRGVKV